GYGARVYWSELGACRKVPLDGGTPITLATGPGNSTYYALAVGAAGVYWTIDIGPFCRLCGGGTTALVEVPIGGGTPTTLALGPGGPGSVAVDATSVYWEAT